MKNRNYRFLLVFVSLVTCMSCTRWKDTEKLVADGWCNKTISFADLKANSDKYDGKEVCLKGTVKEPTNLDGIRQVLQALGIFDTLAEYKFYWLEDGIGDRVFVATENSIPRKDRALTVKAKVNETFRFRGVAYIVLNETQRQD